MKVAKAFAIAVKDYVQLSAQLDEQLKQAAYIDRGDIKLRQYLLIIEFPLQVASLSFNSDYWASDKLWVNDEYE